MQQRPRRVEVRKLAAMFRKAFSLYEREVSDKVRLAGPVA
ncbi:hypothetical protein AG1IA_07517 [Rhizoctonia solani AG-1 IA]|uniref:Uncharacterized protein n=1 Tax=Thanatephorus cucumeris (strain AG1-IA) TaxID=983506 RepID=L8WNV6_THACA|nr:hypothetical protein AG1IA_07517 [Rhizoctonia solani AG-1 IA]